MMLNECLLGGNQVIFNFVLLAFSVVVACDCVFSAGLILKKKGVHKLW